jgi:kumamolisin
MGDVPVGYVALEGSERGERPGAKSTGPEDPAQPLTLSVLVRRRPGAPELPDMSAGGRAYDREEFASLFGAADDDLDAVEQFAHDHSFEVVDRSVARRMLVLAGTVGQASAAFGVQLDHYESAEESFRGRTGPVYVPAALGDVIEGVFGLDNRRMAQRSGSPSPAAVTTPQSQLDVADIYEFPVMEREGALNLTGAGQTIALLEFGGGYLLSDVKLTLDAINVATPTIFTALGTNSPGTKPASGKPGPNGEVTVDITTAAAVAPGATIAMYFAPMTQDGWIQAVTTAIHVTTPRPSVISISWGWRETSSSWTKGAIKAISGAFQEAAALGVTVFVASGDWGSNGDASGAQGAPAIVQYPASDPNVTACGGSTITTAPLPVKQGTWGLSGGGVSTVFPLPTWQAQAGVPKSINPGGAVGRGVPDISGYPGPYNTYVFGVRFGMTGTSLVSPLYAGLVARINEALADEAVAGYLNPRLYLPANAAAFTDIDDGISNAYNGSPGYESKAGWDPCTGLGSVKGGALLNIVGGHPAVSPPPPAKPAGPPAGMTCAELAKWITENATKDSEAADTARQTYARQCTGKPGTHPVLLE